MKKILMILTNPFLPDPRPLKEARLLMKHLYSVDVICWNRGGEVNLPETEIFEEISIKRITSSGAYGKGVRSLVNFFLFYKKAVFFAKGNKYDIIYAHDLDTLIPAYFISKKCKGSLILDLHEQYEGMMMRSNPLLRVFFIKLIIGLKRKLYKNVDLLVYTNEEMIKYDIDNVKREPKDKIIIKNYPERSFIDRIVINPSSDIVLGFFGNVREYRILKQIAGQIEAKKGYLLNVAGSGPDSRRVKEHFQELNNSNYLGDFKYNDLVDLYRDINIVLCLYTINISTINAFPVKFYEAYELCIPVVTYSGTALGDFCSNNNIGFTIRDADEIPDFLDNLSINDIKEKMKNIQMMKKRISFSFESQENEYIEKIQSVISS